MYITFMYKLQAQYKKSRKVDTITSILQKILNPIKFKLLRFRLNVRTKLLKFYLQLFKTIWFTT